MDWDYMQWKVHMSMPRYIKKALQRFNHEPPRKPQNSPYPNVQPQYGTKIQYTVEKGDAPKLGKEDKCFIQQVMGTLLYDARVVDKPYW